MKDIFHVWFQYGTKCFHQVHSTTIPNACRSADVDSLQQLITHCITILSDSFQELIGSSEWEKEWMSLDRDQLTEFLKSSEIYVSSEFELWQAVLKWLQAPAHPERRGSAIEKNLSHLVPLIRSSLFFY